MNVIKNTLVFIKANKLVSFALITAIIVQIAQIFILPLVVTYDGYQYIELSSVLFSSRFPEEWDFFRTPIYPLMLKASFSLMGITPLSIILLNTLCFLGAVGIILLALKPIKSSNTVCLFILLCALNPILIVYEHCALTDCCAMLALALLFFSLTRKFGAIQVATIIAALCFGFFVRPNLLYLSPIAAVLCSYQASASLSKKIAVFIVICAIPFLVASPWLSRAKSAGRIDVQYAFGLLNQVVLSPNDALVSSFKKDYEDAIASSLKNGKLTNTGMRESYVYKLCGPLSSEIKGNIISIISNNKISYSLGVLRTTLALAGIGGAESDTGDFFRKALIEKSGKSLFKEPAELYKKYKDNLKAKHAPLAVTKIFAGTKDFAQMLYAISIGVSLIPLCLGLRKKDQQMLAASLISLGYFFIHALTLFPIDRLVVSTYPLFFLCLTQALGYVVTSAKIGRHS